MQNTTQHRPAAMSEEQRKQLAEKWGEDYSDKDLWELERTYKSLAEDYKGGISSRQRMNLIDLSRWRLERQKLIDAGDVNAAKKISDMIKATMDSEAMKATDIKPTSAMRVDTFAERLEKKGLLKDGVLVLQNVIDYVQTDKGAFHMSRDALDMCMLSMYNAMRFNNGLSEVTEVPREMLVQDALGEFLDSVTPGERNAMMELGMYGSARGDS